MTSLSRHYHRAFITYRHLAVLAYCERQNAGRLGGGAARRLRDGGRAWPARTWAWRDVGEGSSDANMSRILT